MLFRKLPSCGQTLLVRTFSLYASASSGTAKEIDRALLAALDSDPHRCGVHKWLFRDPRENLWQEPIYRNVWSLLDEFGDARVGNLNRAAQHADRRIGSRAKIDGPPGHPRRGARRLAAPGKIVTPSGLSVRDELAQAAELLKGIAPSPKMRLIASGDGNGPSGTADALTKFLACSIRWPNWHPRVRPRLRSKPSSIRPRGKSARSSSSSNSRNI